MTDQSEKCLACAACCRAPCLDTPNCSAPFSEAELEALHTADYELWLAVTEACKVEAPVVPGQPCQFLVETTGRCSIYPKRPSQCQGFEVDGDLCKRAIVALEVGVWH